ncbi:hypothetical protein [Carnobacterium maltaromaticum]|uniref:hypothetical protein n=1 Tax=Carnobacterium maltaromaticum TaxID=2751 RepID=UPI00295F2B68|nr:hypothetical protein [Carnobacterium maltaromaticum]
MNSIELTFKLFKEPKIIETKQEVTYLKNSFLHDVVNQVATELVKNQSTSEETNKINYPDWLTYPGDLTKQVLIEFTFSESESSAEIIGKVIDSYSQKFMENNPSLVVYQLFTLSDNNKIQLFFNFFVEFGYLNKNFFAISLGEAIDKQMSSRNMSIVEWKKKELSELDSLLQSVGTAQVIQLEENEEHAKPLPNTQKVSLSKFQLILDDLATEALDTTSEKPVDKMEKSETSNDENFHYTTNSNSGWKAIQKVNLNEDELLLADKEQITNLNLQVIRLEELTSKLERKLVKAEAEKDKTKKVLDRKEDNEIYLKDESDQNLIALQEENSQLIKKILQLEAGKVNYQQEVTEKIERLKSSNKNFKDQNTELIKNLEIKENLLADLEEKNTKLKQKIKIKGPVTLTKPSHLLKELEQEEMDTTSLFSEKNSFLNDLPEPDFEDMTKKKISSKEYKELIKTVGYIEHIWSIYQTKIKHISLENKEEQIELEVLLEHIDEAAIETFIFSHELSEIKDQVMVKNSVLLGRSTVIINNYDLQSLHFIEKQYYLMSEAIKELSKVQPKENN